MQETQEFWQHPSFSDLGLLKARFTRHRYELHTHPTYVVALVTDGCERLRVGRHSVVAPAASVILVNPEECHDGEPGADSGWAYRTLYPSVDLLCSVARELGHDRVPAFTQPVISDGDLARCIAIAHELAASGDPLEAETSMLIALRHLLLRCADRTEQDQSDEPNGARRRMTIYRDVVAAAVTDGVRLDALAQAAGVTRFQVIRDFKRETGLRPNAFLRQQRLQRARQRIAAGDSIAAAASAAGFADQSHLTRAFKSVHGMTPRVFQRAMQAGGPAPHQRREEAPCPNPNAWIHTAPH